MKTKKRCKGNKLGADIINSNVLSVQMDGEQEFQFYIFYSYLQIGSKISNVEANITNDKMDASKWTQPKIIFVIGQLILAYK